MMRPAQRRPDTRPGAAAADHVTRMRAGSTARAGWATVPGRSRSPNADSLGGSSQTTKTQAASRVRSVPTRRDEATRCQVVGIHEKVVPGGGDRSFDDHSHQHRRAHGDSSLRMPTSDNPPPSAESHAALIRSATRDADRGWFVEQLEDCYRPKQAESGAQPLVRPPLGLEGT